jgi:NADH-quinone oxidoreductase subunit L
MWFADYLHRTPGFAEVHEHGLNVGLVVLSVAVAVGGIALAWLLYVARPELPDRIAAAVGPLYKLSLNKFYFDEMYSAALVAPLRFAAWLSYWFDRTIIDPIVDGLALIPRALSGIPLWIHNGLVPSYALIMWIGLLACVVFALRLLPY